MRNILENIESNEDPETIWRRTRREKAVQITLTASNNATYYKYKKAKRYRITTSSQKYTIVSKVENIETAKINI